MEGVVLGIVVIMGIIFAPLMTIGTIMYHYGHEKMGFILVIIGVIRMIIKLLED